MSDLIDRQRALDAFDYWVKSPMVGYSNGLLRLHEMLEELPQVTQEPCEYVAMECFEDLCRYFGDAKDILKNREDFKAWLDRIKWHIHKAEELKAENDDLRDQLAMRDRFQKQEPCDDCISREDALMALTGEYTDSPIEILPKAIKRINALPPVKPAEKVGHWIKIDDCSNSGYYCSECHKRVVKEGWSDTVKIIKYCPNCGAKMGGEQNG